jgi:hypothetical protein
MSSGPAEAVEEVPVLSKKEKVVVICTVDTVAMPSIQIELALTFGTNFPEGGSVAISVKVTYMARHWSVSLDHVIKLNCM